ncbi:cutinase family protein [Propionibacteriaceae bacterium Y1700]|uniref:cutinase family protein n=1 Tax=Microlunatus sp. Y1700 TaxID=3418487 RepID=UPI003DA722B4
MSVVVLIMSSAVATPAHAVGGLIWPSAPTISTESGSMPCADLLFVGARGSLEDPPYGTTLTNLRTTLAERTATVPDVGRGTVREVFVDYPAVEPGSLAAVGVDKLFFDAELPAADYFDSVERGTSQVAEVLADSARRCPQEKWVLAGYSQGAEVITRGLSRFGDSPQLLGATLLGSPTHHAGQHVTETGGDASESAVGLTASLFYVRHHVAVGRAEGGEVKGAGNGIGAVVVLGQGRADLPGLTAAAQENGYQFVPELAPKVQSLCNAGDMVCDSGATLDGILAGRTTIEQEVKRSWDIHHAYQPDQIGGSVDLTVTAIIGAIPPPEQADTPVETRPSVPWWVIGGGMIMVSVLCAVTLAIVLQRRRAHRHHRSDDDGPAANEHDQLSS